MVEPLKYFSNKSHSYIVVAFILSIAFPLNKTLIAQTKDAFNIRLSKSQETQNTSYFSIILQNPKRQHLTIFLDSQYQTFFRQKTREALEITPDSIFKDTAIIAFSPFPTSSTNLMSGYNVSYSVIREWKTRKKNWEKSFYVKHSNIDKIRVIGIRLNYFLGRKLEKEFNQNYYIQIK